MRNGRGRRAALEVFHFGWRNMVPLSGAPHRPSYVNFGTVALRIFKNQTPKPWQGVLSIKGMDAKFVFQVSEP
jgi:hypothetical protein